MLVNNLFKSQKYLKIKILINCTKKLKIRSIKVKMKIMILVLFGCCQKLLSSNLVTNGHYSIRKSSKVNETISEIYTIEKLEKDAIFFCLSTCNSNKNCLTIGFTKNSISLKYLML